MPSKLFISMGRNPHDVVVEVEDEYVQHGHLRGRHRIGLIQHLEVSLDSSGERRIAVTWPPEDIVSRLSQDSLTRYHEYRRLMAPFENPIPPLPPEPLREPGPTAWERLLEET